MAKVQYNIRLEEEIIEKLQKIAAKEAERTGYRIDVADLVRKALDMFMKGVS